MIKKDLFWFLELVLTFYTLKKNTKKLYFLKNCSPKFILDESQRQCILRTNPYHKGLISSRQSRFHVQPSPQFHTFCVMMSFIEFGCFEALLQLGGATGHADDSQCLSKSACFLF